SGVRSLSVTEAPLRCGSDRSAEGRRAWLRMLLEASRAGCWRQGSLNAARNRSGLNCAVLSHNPEVAGSNPAPATKTAGQRPLPILEGPSPCRVLTGLL